MGPLVPFALIWRDIKLDSLVLSPFLPLLAPFRAFPAAWSSVCFEEVPGPPVYTCGAIQKKSLHMITSSYPTLIKQISSVKIKTRTTFKVKSPQENQKKSVSLNRLLLFFSLLPVPRSTPVGRSKKILYT